MASSSKILLSVLIPVYRRDISLLIVKIAVTFLKLKLAYEIIVFDDSADPEYFEWHSSFNHNRKLRILKAEKNKGRSGSRNFLMQQATGSHCLLLDGDMEIAFDFIPTYLDAIEANPEKVLVGGITYDPESAGLRKRIGAAKEEIPAAIRQNHPYQAFTAANVVLPLAVAKSIQFDESIVTYGHEDTVFGLTLKDKNIPIVHLDNPAVHQGLDDDETYFQKIEESLRTLAGLWLKNSLIRKHANEVKLLRIWLRLRLILAWVPTSELLLGKLNKKAKKSIFWLDTYKLLYFQHQLKQQRARL